MTERVGMLLPEQMVPEVLLVRQAVQWQKLGALPVPQVAPAPGGLQVRQAVAVGLVLQVWK